MHRPPRTARRTPAPTCRRVGRPACQQYWQRGLHARCCMNTIETPSQAQNSLRGLLKYLDQASDPYSQRLAHPNDFILQCSSRTWACNTVAWQHLELLPQAQGGHRRQALWTAPVQLGSPAGTPPIQIYGAVPLSGGCCRRHRPQLQQARAAADQLASAAPPVSPCTQIGSRTDTASTHPPMCEMFSVRSR